MKRDMDLFRDLLLRMEASPKIYSGRRAMAIEGHSVEEVTLHIKLLEDAGYTDNPSPWQPFPGGASMEIGMRLTHSGYDLLDSIRDPEIWAKTKAGANAAGGFTLDLLKGLAKGFIKKKIEEHTGVQIDL